MTQEITYNYNPPKYEVEEIPDYQVHAFYLKKQLTLKECIKYSEYKMNERTYFGGA